MPVVVLMIALVLLANWLLGRNFTLQALISVTIIFSQFILHQQFVKEDLSVTNLLSSGTLPHFPWFSILVSPVFTASEKSIVGVQLWDFFLATIVVVNYKTDTPEGNRNNFLRCRSTLCKAKVFKVEFYWRQEWFVVWIVDEKYGEFDSGWKKYCRTRSTFLGFCNIKFGVVFSEQKTRIIFCQILPRRVQWWAQDVAEWVAACRHTVASDWSTVLSLLGITIGRDSGALRRHLPKSGEHIYSHLFAAVCYTGSSRCVDANQEARSRK